MDVHLKYQHELKNNLKNTFTSIKNETIDFWKDLYPKLGFKWLNDALRYFVNEVLMEADLITIFYYIFFIGFFLWTIKIITRATSWFRAWNGKVQLEWDVVNPPKLGETAVFKILIFLSGQCGRFLQFFPPPGPESVRELLVSVSVKIKLEGQDIILKKDIDPQERMIYVTFKIEKAGKYDIQIWYNGYSIGGTPFFVTVEPDCMDPSKTLVSLKTPIIATQGKQFRLDIIPIDQYGNKCSANSDDLLRLGLNIRKLGQKNGSSVDVDSESRIRPEMLSSFGLRRDTGNMEEIMTVITLYLKPETVGVYYVTILYNEKSLTSTANELEIISMSIDEELLVELKDIENMKGLSGISFPATLINEYQTENKNLNEYSTKKEVILNLSPRFMYLKERLHGSPIFSRLVTFRLCPQNKVELLDSILVENNLEYILRISGEIMSHAVNIQMGESDARIFIALVAKNLSCTKSVSPLSFEVKQESFYNKLRSLPQWKSNGMSYKLLKIRREHFIESTLQETMNFNADDWRKPFVVSFYDEPVKADKLAWLEWSQDLLDAFFENNSHKMFCSLGSSGLIHPNPSRNSRWTNTHYELAGKIAGKYLFETALDFGKENGKYFVNTRFTRSFLAQMLSLQPTYQNLELDDPEMYMGSVDPLLKTDVTSMNLNFVGPYYDEFGNVSMRDLIPCGSAIPVTETNKIVYLNEFAKLHLAANVKKEIEAFASGLMMIVPEELLMNLNENELELMMCGYTTFNIKDLQHHHIISGEEWNPHVSRIKGWLWESLRQMDGLDMGRFLQFVTGSSVLPVGGFSDLKPRLKISISCLYGQIPTANNVLHQLSLTDHPSFQDFFRALTEAIRGADVQNCNDDGNIIPIEAI